MNPKEKNLEIRKYRPQDCAEMARLFYDTVHTVNAADYTEKQLDAWADGYVDPERWNASFLEHDTLVAWEAGETEKTGRIVGFGDMDPSGYLDRLYVHKDFQKKGIAAALCDRLERHVRERAVFRKRGDAEGQTGKEQSGKEQTGKEQPGEERAELLFTTHASITARPFFEKRGYVVKKEQQVERHGILLTNYVMERTETLELVRLSARENGAQGEEQSEKQEERSAKKDIEACARILMDSFAHAWNTREEADRTIGGILESGILVAIRRNGETAGFVGALPQYPFGWELHPLAVAEGLRDMGLGSLLVSRIEREAAKAGALVLYLGTDDEDGATSLSEGDLFQDTLEKIKEIRNYGGHPFSFYQKCGYRIVGVLPDVNGPGKPDIFMAKRLSAGNVAENKKV